MNGPPKGGPSLIWLGVHMVSTTSIPISHPSHCIASRSEPSAALKEHLGTSPPAARPLF
jgi:hypothetical protein